jgi:hypothetical protein
LQNVSVLNEYGTAFTGGDTVLVIGDWCSPGGRKFLRFFRHVKSPD